MSAVFYEMPPGILLASARKARASIVRLPDIPFEERKRVLAAVLARHKEDLEKGSIVTVAENRIRVRKLTGGHWFLSSWEKSRA